MADRDSTLKQGRTVAFSILH